MNSERSVGDRFVCSLILLQWIFGVEYSTFERTVMDYETTKIIWNVFVALGSISVGIVVLTMFVFALKRKGPPAILLLPFVLWLFFWQPWHSFRARWVTEFVGYESYGLQLP